MRFIDRTRPLIRLLPEVTIPLENMSFQDKAAWTMGATLIYLVLSNFKLYGASISTVPDPFFWLRPSVGSSRGTLMEFGVTPIATSGFVLQVLSGLNMIGVRQDLNDERALFGASQKLFSIILVALEAVLYVLSGMLGDPSTIGVVNVVLLILQLVFAGVILVLLDEVIQKGYGLGSGLNMFVTANVCRYFLTNALSPSSVDLGNGREFEGAIIALFHFMIFRSDRINGLKEVFTRQHLPNLTNLFGILIVFGLAILLQGIRYDVPVKSNRVRGQSGAYPIKFFYTSGIPLFFFTTVVANVYFLTHVLYKFFGNNFIMQVFGYWQQVEGSPNHIYPTAGLAHLVTPPTSILGAIRDPFHTLFYLSFIVVVCGIFSRIWIEITGNTSRDIAKFFQEQQLAINNINRNESITKYLDTYVPMSALLGGMCIGFLSVLGDFLTSTGFTAGVLMSMATLFQYYEMFAKERARINAKQQQQQ